MKVAFLKGTGLIDRLIQIWTFSKYSHCEIIFSDGITFGNGLAFPYKTQMSHKLYSHVDWDFVEVAVSKETEQKMMNFCWTQVDKEYDWKAIFFSMILPFRQQNPNKWICSEIGVEIFRQGGYFRDVKPCTVNPGKFYKLLQKIKK